MADFLLIAILIMSLLTRYLELILVFGIHSAAAAVACAEAAAVAGVVEDGPESESVVEVDARFINDVDVDLLAMLEFEFTRELLSLLDRESVPE